ncbi:MAG: 5-oxoprolinase subunit PxpB [Chthoniobacterales bacterium]|jgi:KipI family sensor histidine kinase inhibitor
MEWSAQPYGPRAWLVRFGRDLSEATMLRALAVARELEKNPPAGLREFTMGYTSALLEFDQAMVGGAAIRIGKIIERLAVPGPVADEGRLVEIPVVYDGEDLAVVARHTGLAEREVIARHSGRDYRVWLLGFAPGFPYLGGLDDALHLPRRAKPRTRIAAGSVAIAGSQTGIYPSESAGGWHILGRTAATLFNPQAAEPFLLRPGDTVRFVAVGAHDV